MKAAQNQAVRFSRIVPALLVSTLIFARRLGHSPDDAQDLTQSFFLHVVRTPDVTGLDQLKR